MIKYLIIFFILLCTQANAANVTLAWDPVQVATGYKLYVGYASRQYNPPIDVKNVTQYSLSNIREGVDIFFAVKAYNTTDESDFSEELKCYTLLPQPVVHGKISPQIPVVVSSVCTTTFTFTPDEYYKIYKTDIDGVSVGSAQSLTFTNVIKSHTIFTAFTISGAPTPKNLSISSY